MPFAFDPALIRFCLEHSDGHVEDRPIPQRDPQAYVWLREALDNLESDVDRMKKLVEICKNPQSTPDEIKAALEQLQFYVEDLDNANDLNKIDGIEPVVSFLEHPEDDVRYWATFIVATVAQNNPTGQLNLIKHGTIGKLIALLQREKDLGVLQKSVAALSAIISGNPTAEAFFLHRGGLEALAGALASEAVPIQRKIFWFLMKLLKSQKDLKSQMRDLNFLQPAMKACLSSDDDLREISLKLLLEMIEDHEANKETAKELQLGEILEKRLENVKKNKEDPREEAKLIEEILQILKK